MLRLTLPALVVAIAGVLASAPATSQTFDATSLRPAASLGGTWLVLGGDDPAYAAADFDDAQWRPFNLEKQSLHDLYPTTRQDVVWYRLHIRVDPSQSGLTLAEYCISAAAIVDAAVNFGQSDDITVVAVTRAAAIAVAA